MNVTIDLGNVWEMLSAVGTIVAVIVSLFLAFRESKPNLNVRVSIEESFHRYYNLVLIKKPVDGFSIVGFGYYDWFRKVSYSDSLMEDTEILGKDGFSIGQGVPFDFSDRSILKLSLKKEHTSMLIGKKIRFYVEDIDGKVYKSNKIIVKKLKAEVNLKF